MSTPADIFVATAVHAWKTQVQRTEERFVGRTDEQLLDDIAPGRNRLVYVWGHLIAVNDGILPLLGLGPRMHPELEAPFIRQSDRALDTVLPSADELKRYSDEVHSRLAKEFAAFTVADWMSRHTQVSEADFALNPQRNKLAILLSRTSHIAYHLGQAALTS